jgi:Glycosyl transferases group 1
MILYFCPDEPVKSAGIRILYRHVEVLQRHSFPAAILHRQPGFRMPDMPAVTTRYLASPDVFSDGDVVVIPEGYTDLMNDLKTRDLRRMVIALNWQYIYASLPNGLDWRSYGIEWCLTHSPFIADYVTWAMRIPSHVFAWGIKPDYYYFDPAQKKRQVAFLKRKQRTMDEFIRVLYSRNPKFVQEITWIAMDDLAEADYARIIRQSSLFLNLSEAEGLPCSLLEAMRAGTLVAGYNSIGGRRELIGAGARQNCLLVENLDYPALARLIEPVLEAMLAGDLAEWAPIRQNAVETAANYSIETEEQSIVTLWRQLLKG